MGKSESCFDLRTGAPLWEYETHAEAVRAARLRPLEWREHEAYECYKCGKWHRRPVTDSAPAPNDALCLMCKGRDGQPKQSYPTAATAMEAAASLPAREELGVYECPHGRGWHLTRG